MPTTYNSSETKLIVLDALDKFKRTDLNFNDKRYMLKGEALDANITYASVSDEEIDAIFIPQEQN